MHSEQAAPDLLQKSLDASGVGWWQLDFGQREMTCSRLAADLFGADRTRISFEEVYLLPGEEHRARIYTRCAALKVSDSLDETFVTANGDRCLQVRAVAAANDPLTGVRSVFGTVRRVTEGTPENAELASINQSYKATQRNYSHLAQLIDSPADFKAVIGLVEPLYIHAAHILSFLPPTEINRRTNADRDSFFNGMPPTFSRAELLEHATETGINANTAQSWLHRLLKHGAVQEMASKGHYRKT